MSRESQTTCHPAARPSISVRELIIAEGVAVAVGVHNALGAMIAQEAGADALWVSSFEVHAAARLPDADILGTADYVDVVSKIADRVDVPLLVDGNAGGGNAINTIRLVREFQKAGASGICIEDNVFPKRCSFYKNSGVGLEHPRTFAGKIRAALEQRCDAEFAVIARTEALIQGLGVNVALERAKVYADAGADAILIHHKGSDAEDVLRFAEAWYSTESTPLVCVPTTYGETPIETFEAAGFRLVIFANYGIRASIMALQNTFAAIMNRRRLADGDAHVVPMEEVFRLVFVDELNANELRYVL